MALAYDSKDLIRLCGTYLGQSCEIFRSGHESTSIHYLRGALP